MLLLEEERERRRDEAAQRQSLPAKLLTCTHLACGNILPALSCRHRGTCTFNRLLSGDVVAAYRIPYSSRWVTYRNGSNKHAASATKGQQPQGMRAPKAWCTVARQPLSRALDPLFEVKSQNPATPPMKRVELVTRFKRNLEAFNDLTVSKIHVSNSYRDTV
jgi:hypothetical protein